MSVSQYSMQTFDDRGDRPCDLYTTVQTLVTQSEMISSQQVDIVYPKLEYKGSTLTWLSHPPHYRIHSSHMYLILIVSV